MEGDEESVKAAMENDALAATLFLSVAHEEIVTWSQVVARSVAWSEELKEALARPRKWGSRRKRSRGAEAEVVTVAKEDEAVAAARRTSPTTPLSWNGAGSGSSESVCGDGESSRRPAAVKKRPRPRKVYKTGESSQQPAPPSKKPKVEAVYHRATEPATRTVTVAETLEKATLYADGEPSKPPMPAAEAAVAEMPAAGVPYADGASNKVAIKLGWCGPGDPSGAKDTTVIRQSGKKKKKKKKKEASTESSRSKLPPNEGAKDTTVIGRPGRKKKKKQKYLELKATEEMLLQEKEGLLNALAKKREIHSAMILENYKLLERSILLLGEGNPSLTPALVEEANPEQHHHLQANSNPESQTVVELAAPSVNVSEEEEERLQQPEQLGSTTSSSTGQAPSYLFDLNSLPVC